MWRFKLSLTGSVRNPNGSRTEWKSCETRAMPMRAPHGDPVEFYGLFDKNMCNRVKPYEVLRFSLIVLHCPKWMTQDLTWSRGTSRFSYTCYKIQYHEYAMDISRHCNVFIIFTQASCPELKCLHMIYIYIYLNQLKSRYIWFANNFSSAVQSLKF